MNKKNIFIIVLTIISFTIGYFITNLFDYTFTTLTTYVFLVILLIELIIMSVINRKKTILIKIAQTICYLLIYIFLMIISLATYGYDVRLKDNYVIRRSLLDFKPVRHISKSPNIFIKSKNLEYCHLIDGMCD